MLPNDTKFIPAGKRCDESYRLSSTSAGYVLRLGYQTEVHPKPDVFNIGDEEVFHY